MSYWVYVLQSERTGKYYCGQTNDLNLRLKEHNNPNYHSTKTTKRFEGPWGLILKWECHSRSEAMSLERTIKKRGISRFLRDKGLIEPSGC